MKGEVRYYCKEQGINIKPERVSAHVERTGHTVIT